MPLLVRFGTQEFRSGVDLSTADFWTRMLAPDAPFPTTAAAAPGTFAECFSDAFAAGADSVVCVTVGSRLSGTFASAEIGAKQHPDREIHVVDSMSASMGVGHLAMLGAELAAAGETGAAIAATLRERTADVDLYVAVDTLEYLRKGGRLSTTRAAIGTLLSVKPIITVVDGAVETVDRVRTRARARERVIEPAHGTAGGADRDPSHRRGGPRRVSRRGCRAAPRRRGPGARERAHGGRIRRSPPGPRRRGSGRHAPALTRVAAPRSRAAPGRRPARAPPPGPGRPPPVVSERACAVGRRQ